VSERTAEARLLAASLVAGSEEAGALAGLASGVSDWGWLVETAERGAVGAALHRALVEADVAGALPPALAERLAERAMACAARSLLLTRTALLVDALLEARGLGFAWIKGAALLAAAPADANVREMVDLDLLVRPGDIEAADEALRQAGWERTATARGYGRRPLEEAGLRLLATEMAVELRSPDGVILELHHALAGRLPRRAEALGVLERAARRPVRGGSLRVASPPDLLAIAAHHVVEHHAGDLAFLPRLLLDMAILLRLPEPGDAGSAPEPGPGLSSAPVRFALEAHAAVVAWLRSGELDQVRAGSPLAELLAMLEAPARVDPRTGPWLARTADRARFAWRNVRAGGLASLFPPREFMAERYGGRATGLRLAWLHLRRLVTGLWRGLTARERGHG